MTTPAPDLSVLRDQFPALQQTDEQGQPFVYFDGPGGSQVPQAVIDAMADYLVQALEKIHRDWPWVKLVTVWNLSQPEPGDPFGGYSLLNSTGQPRPAYAAWQQAAGNRLDRGISLAAVEQHNPVTILAQDAIVHIGDTNVLPPWWPLYAGRDPSLTWTGGFYLTDPGDADW